MGCVLTESLAAVPDAAQASRPNVLFIAIDDLNDWVGVMGGHRAFPGTCIGGCRSRACRG